MYTIIHETDDSTTVNFSESGRFFPENGPQLVTIGGKHLRFHRLNPYALVPHDDQQWRQTTRLECLLSVRLIAPPRSLALARVPQNPDCDSLLLAFDDAKLSIVCIDATERSLRTLSLHSFEDEILREGYVTNLPSPVIRVDPGQRCCAMLVFSKYLAVIPFEDSSAHMHSYVVQLSSIDAKLINVIDFAFMDGYYEPTLLFLYEPAQTTAGRACIRYDNISVMGVSLNPKEQVHAAVWHLTSLPMDCLWLLPIPQPVSGILIVACNSLIYLNQSVPPCGIAVNSCLDGFTKFPLQDMRIQAITFEGCAACCIDTNKVLLSIRSGRLFLVTLVTDETNSVKSLDLVEQFETSIPYTMTFLAPGYLFLGSRLGDSLIIQYMNRNDPQNDSLLPKMAKLDNIGEEIFEEDDIELYGKPIQDLAGTTKSAFSGELQFRVIDRLFNVAPCKKMCAGSPHGLSPYFQESDRLDPVFDMVCACGHGKDSSICIFERSIRPDVITSSYIPGVLQYWAIGRREDDTHKYIIASKEHGSLILETDNDLVELEAAIFTTSESTIAAGELADGGISVQVTTSSIVIVAEDMQLQHISLQLTFPVIGASIIDPYVAVLTQNGKLLLYELVSVPHIHLKVVETPSAFNSCSPITALNIYRDMSGNLRFCSAAESSQQSARFGRSNEYFDDLDDYLLYGDTFKRKRDLKFKRKVVESRHDEFETPLLETDIIDPNLISPTFWLVLARENGNLYIHSIPQLSLVYMVKKLINLPDVVSDECDFDAQSEIDTYLSDNPLSTKPEEVVIELLLFGMGMNQTRPILLLLLDDTIFFYEMFAHDNGIQGHLAIRFKKTNLSSSVRSTHFHGLEARADLEIGRDTLRHRMILHPFERIGNIPSGVFICSPYPSMFFIDSGGLRIHPVTIDGPLLSFTTFNYAICPNGFIYLTDREKTMRIAKLTDEINLDASYPFRKIPIGRTVHQLVYLMQPNIYVLTVSEQKPVRKLCVTVNEEKAFEEFEKSETFVLPVIDQYTVLLYSPDDWKPVPNTEIALDEFEVVTACEEVQLKSESTVSGVQNYLSVGTSYNYGEEVMVRGRIIISEIIEVVPEPGQPTSKHRIKILYDKEQKGPVTSLCSCNGYLLTGMGQKIFIWAFRDNNLQGISFLDMHFYVHNLVSVRGLALACDMYKSLALILYQEEYKALSLVSRDMRTEVKSPMVSQFIVDSKQLGFLMSDEYGNMTVFNYLPETVESCGGEKLIVRAEINIGTNVNALVRVKGHVSSGFAENKELCSGRHSVFFASLDGSFGFVRPLSEKVFRRLHMLHQLISSTVVQVAGLNPRGSRAVRPLRPSHFLNTRNIVDGDVVMQYLHLSIAEKNELARKLGTSRYHIIDDLVEIRRLTTHF